MKTDKELIAEFMGMPPAYYEGYRQNGDFDTSWDLLMPVVEKIDKIYHETFPGNEEFIRRILANEEPLDGPYMDIIALPIATPIEEVFKAAVEFIKWYNETNKR